ncbi:MAG: SCO family protein [Deltaproteobacteria bacterium]|nr:MAG: SCO family protein [Deltaproteobacteria bacterium]
MLRTELRRRLVLVGWGLALGLCFAIWRWPDRVLGLRHGNLPTTRQECALASTPCTARFSDGLAVSIAASPLGLPRATPLRWSVAVADGVHVASRLELTGVNMPMGLTRIPLEPVGPGRFEGQGSLPMCTESRMLWRAEVTVESPDGGPPRIAAFEFWSDDGAAAPVSADGRGAAAPDAPAPTYGPLTLDTVDGPLSLADLRGQVVVVYFGYTACPDYCPTTLSTVAAAVGLLRPEEQERVTALMVSLDPERDDLERLDRYARAFNPRFRGGTASIEALDRMSADWGVAWRKVPLPDSALGYAIDHGTDSFLVDPDGTMIRRIPHGTPPDEIARLLRAALGSPTR